MKYRVGYYKMGKLFYDGFDDLDTAINDYHIKLKLDIDGIFDDRFVVGVYRENKKELTPVIERFKK